MKHSFSGTVIQLEFNPFSVAMPWKDELQKFESVEVLSDVDWCSLPDILYAELSREFVGLSFAVDLGREDFAQRLVEISKSSHVRFVPAIGSGSLDRYSGFGPCSRLEVFWTTSIETIKCEPASLYDGAWVIDESREGYFKGVRVPAYYRLFDMNDILLTHELKSPSNCFLV